jgi:hypothetical protein
MDILIKHYEKLNHARIVRNLKYRLWQMFVQMRKKSLPWEQLDKRTQVVFANYFAHRSWVIGESRKPLTALDKRKMQRKEVRIS